MDDGDNDDDGDDDGNGGGGGGGNENDEKEDLYDITAAAAAAEADILDDGAAAATFATATRDSSSSSSSSSARRAVVPPVDLFAGPRGWTVHAAVPGARSGRRDVGVCWDRERSVLRIRGVVRRPSLGKSNGDGDGDGDGDGMEEKEEMEMEMEMVWGERTLGAFERCVQILPAPTGKGTAKEVVDVVDVEGIEFGVRDGVLVVTVPRRGAR